MTKDFLKISTNTAAQFIARSVTTVTTLIITLLVTRNLSQSDWGIFITITSYVALFYLIVDFGLNGVVVRELQKKKEDLSVYFGNLLSLRVLLSAFAIFLALVVLSFASYSNFVKFGIIISLLTILALALFNTGVAVFQARLRYDQAALADIVGALVTLVLAYLSIISGFNIISIVIAYVIGGLVRAFISLYLSTSYVSRFSFQFDTRIWKYLLLTALPIGLTLVFSQFVANIDKQIIYLANYDPALNINNETAAGFYGLAYRIFEFGILIPAFFVNSIYPLLLRDQKKNLAVLKSKFFVYGRLLLVSGIIVTVIVFILSPYLVSIFGEYTQSTTPLRILSLGYVFFFVTPLIMWTVITLGKEKLLPFVFGIALLLNVAFNLYFVPKFGFTAAAVVTVFTELFILILLLVIITPILINIKPELDNSIEQK